MNSQIYLVHYFKGEDLTSGDQVILFNGFWQAMQNQTRTSIILFFQAS